ncbi:MAG: glutamate--tRNA ligase family protein [Planctomycetota bacterium]
MSAERVSRLAPSPTGALHLGNARTFLINWAVARNLGWRLVMRIEDLDGPRIKTGTAEQILDTLAWIGLDFDGSPLQQSHDLEPYRQAMQQLAQQGRTYACRLTRTEIEVAASAPHGSEHELRYPIELRPPDAGRGGFDCLDTNYRLIVPDEAIEVEDQFTASRHFRPFEEVGDFVIWTKRATPAYQLAVVVDDIRQGVTDVVRGDDLLPSAARQMLLYRALGHEPPRWWHVPMVVGRDGKRLAKRHGDTRLEAYRRAGVPPERIVGLLAYWCGVSDRPREMLAGEFRSGFCPTGVSRGPITFTETDHRWLHGDG